MVLLTWCPGFVAARSVVRTLREGAPQGGERFRSSPQTRILEGVARKAVPV